MNVTFYCAGRKPGTPTGCNFKIYVKYNVTKRVYTIEKSIIEHNHSIVRKTSGTTKRTTITKRSQLSSTEREYIKSLGPETLNVQFLREHLENIYLKLLFSNTLLYRLLNNGRRKFKGASDIQRLYAMGKKLEKDGGSYHLYDMERVKLPTLKGAVFQTKAQRDAVEIYGDLLFLDSTHGLSSYLIQTSLPTLVDCYGESFICGIQFYQSENFANVSDGILFKV